MFFAGLLSCAAASHVDLPTRGDLTKVPQGRDAFPQGRNVEVLGMAHTSGMGLRCNAIRRRVLRTEMCSVRSRWPWLMGDAQQVRLAAKVLLTTSMQTGL